MSAPPWRCPAFCGGLRGPCGLSALPVNAWSLRSVYARSLAKLALPTFWWTLVIAGFAAWMVVVVKQTEDQLKTLAADSSFIKDLITRIGGAMSASMPTS